VTRKSLLTAMAEKPADRSDEDLLKEVKGKTIKGYGKTAGEEVKRMNIFLPEHLHRQLKSTAGASGVTMNDIIVDLIKSHVGGKS
jgi:predicted HicB family RNase H-like nuclease